MSKFKTSYKVFIISIINILILTSMMFNLGIKEKKGFNFVAATLDKPCKFDVSHLDPICNPIDPDEEGECCPDIGGGEPDEQQYCYDNNQADAYCDGGLCTCHPDEIEPGEGDSYGVATCTGTGCGGLSSLSCKGMYIGGLCLKGFFYSINENALTPPNINVFVKGKLDWILTEKGELMPVKVTITVW